MVRQRNIISFNLQAEIKSFYEVNLGRIIKKIEPHTSQARLVLGSTWKSSVVLGSKNPDSVQLYLKGYF